MSVFTYIESITQITDMKCHTFTYTYIMYFTLKMVKTEHFQIFDLDIVEFVFHFLAQLNIFFFKVVHDSSDCCASVATAEHVQCDAYCCVISLLLPAQTAQVSLIGYLTGFPS